MTPLTLSKVRKRKRRNPRKMWRDRKLPWRGKNFFLCSDLELFFCYKSETLFGHFRLNLSTKETSFNLIHFRWKWTKFEFFWNKNKNKNGNKKIRYRPLKCIPTGGKIKLCLAAKVWNGKLISFEALPTHFLSMQRKTFLIDLVLNETQLIS
jgi:hypothetical protein